VLGRGVFGGVGEGVLGGHIGRVLIALKLLIYHVLPASYQSRQGMPLNSLSPPSAVAVVSVCMFSGKASGDTNGIEKRMDAST
jgi:hypothetical protein